jgi:ribonuclease E
MLINVLHPEEARVAIVQDGRLMELNIEISGKEQTKGNIYKGVVVRVEPGLQAAFVDIGHKKPGFIQMGDLHPASWQWREDLPEEERKRRPRIQDVLRRGQELIVQVEKDARDMKGAALTSYLSLPGRYMVLMPGDDAAGISRKIEDNATRKELKALVAELQVPAGYGYIVRTEAVGRTGEELKKDLDYLIGVHERILQQAATIKGAGEIYQDAGVIIRTIRDYFSDDIDEVLVDDKAACQQAIDFFKEIMPGCERLVKLHKEKRPIFSKYQLEEQIDQLYEKRVPLPSGGSLIIEPTEALVSIDVNSGKSSGEKGVEDTAFKTNLEAAAEVARQLRLRDLGGLVVIDFIDMRDNKHNKEVERALKDALKMDKARVNLGRISQFGMMEMSRQRIAKNINDAIHLECPHCEGRGRVKSVEAMAVSFLRKVHAAAAKGQIAEVRGGLPLEVAYFLLNRKKRELAQIENDYDIVVTIKGKPSFLLNQLELETVRKEKQREELPELELPQQSAPVDSAGSVTTPQGPEGEVVTEAAAKKRRKRKRKKKSVDRPADAPATEQAGDAVDTAVPDASVAPTVEEAVLEQPDDPLEPAAKKRRRSRPRRKPAAVKAAEAESGGQDAVDAGSPQVSVPVNVSDGDGSALPVKAARPKRAAKKVATVVETNIGEGQPVPPVDPVVVKPAGRARKSPARKKTAQEPAENVGEPVEPVAAPKARKRPASRSKKSAAVAADEGKE